MTNEFLHLEKIIDLEKWQKLQDSIALTSKMAIVMVDYKGTPVTKHSQCHDFCQTVRSSPELFQYCKRCDARGGLEAVRQNAPYIYHCHYNIVDMAIPITIDDKYLGAIMAGQVRIKKENHLELEQIITIPEHLYAQNKDALEKDFNILPELPYSEIAIIAEMLFRLVNYIVEEAMNKNLVIETYEKMYAKDKEGIGLGYTPQNLQTIKKNLSNTLLDSQLQSVSQQTHICKNLILEPFFTYMYAHKSESISLKKAADICHISPSYFSRIFAKETGETYSNYLSRLKVVWGKQLLITTDMNVAQVSEELGFNEAGYFIKTFKKYEGTTPFLYRKHYTK